MYLYYYILIIFANMDCENNAMPDAPGSKGPDAI
jgi:hypothetical protein